MSWKKIALLVVLADFTAYTVYAIAQQGYSAFFDLFLGTPIGIQVFADLVIALSLFAIWMFEDARKHGISAVPYLLLMLCLGSIGALAYLVRRPEPVAAAEPQLARAH